MGSVGADKEECRFGGEKGDLPNQVHRRELLSTLDDSPGERNVVDWIEDGSGARSDRETQVPGSVSRWRGVSNTG